MSGQKVRVHAFKINMGPHSRRIEDVFQAVAKDNVPDRERLLGRTRMRVRIDDIQHIAGNRWLFDIVLRRYEGPGRSPDGSATADFSIGSGDRFGEETAGLYDVANQRLFLQYSHHGVRIGRLLEYMAAYHHDPSDAYEGLFELDPNFKADLNARGIARHIEASVVPGELTAADRRANISVRHAMDMADHTGANVVDIGLRATSHKNDKMNNRAVRMRDRLMTLLGKNPDAFKSLKYTGKKAPDDQARTLDLMKCRWHHTEEGLPIGAGRRVEQSKRYDLLKRAAKSF